MDSKRSVVAKGLGEGKIGWKGGAQRIFRAVKLYDTVMVDSGHFSFVKTYRTDSTKNEF